MRVSLPRNVVVPRVAVTRGSVVGVEGGGAKLTETTYFGVLIAWAQEVERYCKEIGANYDEAVSFYEEIPYLPRVKFFPGVIGGHCVLPNIKILKGKFKSGILDAIEQSNEIKQQGLGAEGWSK